MTVHYVPLHYVLCDSTHQSQDCIEGILSARLELCKYQSSLISPKDGPTEVDKHQ